MEPKPSQIQSQTPQENPSNPTQNHFTFPNTTADKCNVDAFDHQRRKQEQAMDKFRAAVMKIATSDGPLTPAQKMLVEERLSDFFTHFRTPDHPAYSAMIHRAIGDLNEEGGSSEESISEFIRKQYDDLPWAHSTLLKHHLRKLCECGEIVVTSDQRYLFADAITNATSSLCSNPKRQQMKRKWRGKREQSRGRSKRRKKKDKFEEMIGEKNELTEKQVEVIEGQTQVEEQQKEVIEIESESKEQDNGLVGQNQQQEQENGVCEGQNQPIEQTDEQNQPPEQQTDVIEEKHQPLEQQDEVTEGKNYQEERQIEIIAEVNPLEPQQKEQQKEANEDQSQLDGQHNEVRGEKLQSCDDGQNGVDNVSMVLPIGSSRLIMKEQKKNVLEEWQQQMESPFGNGEFVDICRLREKQKQEGKTFGRQKSPRLQSTTVRETLVDLIMDSEHLEKENHSEHPSPERPPGFDSTVEKLYKSHEQEAKNCGLELCVEQKLPIYRPTTMRTSPPFEPEQHLEVPNPKGPPKLCAQLTPLEPQPKPMTTSLDLPAASQQLELDQKLEVSNPEGYPDFCCQQKHTELYLKTKTTSLDISMNSQQQLQFELQHEGPPESHPTLLPPSTTVTTFDLPIVSQLLEQEQQPELPNSEEPSELSGQQKPPEFLPMTLAAPLTGPMYSEPLEQCQPELVKPPEVELENVEKVDELTRTLQEMREEQRQLRSRGQNHSKSKPVTVATVVELLPLHHQQQQQQQPEVSDSERLQEIKSTEMEAPSKVQQQQAKQCGRRKWTISKSKAMITQSVLMNSEQLEQEQPSELPNPEKSREIKLTTVEPLSEEQKLQPKVCGKRKAPESQPEMVTGSLDFPKDSEQQPDVSVPEEPMELEVATMDQLSTVRMQRQLRRWGRRISEYKPAVTSMVELLPSSWDQHQEQLELPNRERPQELNQTPAEESTQSTERQTKLCGWQKLPISQPKTMIDSLDSPLPLQQLELEQKLPSPERAQEQQNQHPQEKLQRRQLRHRPPKPQPFMARSMAELVPSQHQHEKQQQPHRRGRGRPSKPKSDRATTEEESSPSDHQNQHEQQQTIKSPSVEGEFFDICGLQAQQQPELPSLKMSHELKPVEELSMTQDQQQQQQQQRAKEKPHCRQLRPRPPNLEAASATATPVAELLSSQLQREEQEADQQKPERRGRGRPPLPKPDTATTVEELLPSDHQHQQQQPVRRGRGRPPKLKPETAATKEELLPSAYQNNPQQQQHQEKPKCRGRGRPPKPKPDTTDTTA